MKKTRQRRNDCDFVALNRNHIAFTGTAHVRRISIQTDVLPRPLVFPREKIAYVHFKKRPYQAEDFIQLTSGGSATGSILNLDPLDFTIAETGERESLPRSSLLTLIFFCSLDSAVASNRARRRTTARR